MTDKEVKVCPFCGGEAKIKVKEGKYLKEYLVFVECKKCHASTRHISVYDYYCEEEEFVSEVRRAKNASVRKWNKREEKRI